ncbi:hypothetical protein [Burkholderia cepacia]|uniref:hypothetical protein n=1 Tax=Burkholderia cepacia TaxID=292 RepID=UPI0020193B0D|nr:hypothetical protein [Burkholderia cepacia]UQO39933.1 hypothetical protein L0Z22_35040 [Burkholderia cepacia]UQO49218.1 hypothetical protein L0Z05_20840 [Burkholderia cepacia]UQP08906.1 hypothetical protein L0Z01_35025 [Burkholderia cepacia]
MLSISFWNVGEAAQGSNPIVDLASSIAADATLSGPTGDCLICLAEPGGLDGTLLANDLVVKDGRPWWAKTALSGRFIVIGTVPPSSLKDHSEEGGAYPWTVVRDINGKLISVEICFVHLSSPHGDWKPSDFQLMTASLLRKAIEAHENTAVNGTTLVIGDFNMRPYDSGMINPIGMHAAPCVASTAKPRKINGQTYSYFYNPMWELQGNWSATRQPGTFYKRNASEAMRWHIIDQVLTRPCAAQLLNGPPRIFTKAGATDLVTVKGVINKSVSDHLPVATSLNI